MAWMKCHKVIFGKMMLATMPNQIIFRAKTAQQLNNNPCLVKSVWYGLASFRMLMYEYANVTPNNAPKTMHQFDPRSFLYQCR